MNFTVLVEDEKGQVVEGCEVRAHPFLKWKKGEGFGTDIYETVSEQTDKNGAAEFKLKSSRDNLKLKVVAPAGFYEHHTIDQKFQKGLSGQWEIDDGQLKVKLRRIKKPIPMYARRMGAGKPFEIPIVGQDVGFDLVISDWVVPHGKGKNSDLIVHMERRFVDIYDFDCTLTIRFSNPKDGIISEPKPVRSGSFLRLAYQAPEKGYQSELVKKAFAHPPSKAITTGIDREQNYYFRVRTILDDKGEIKSAYYGKIHGDFEFARFAPNTGLKFTYYLNGKENDRNLEFDVKGNLLRNLSESERVGEP